MYIGYVGPTAEQMAKMKPYYLVTDAEAWLTGTTYIGLKVRKCSNKPFKSGEKVNTVKDVVRNPNTNLWAVSFFEDDSVVDVKQVTLVGTD